jgi:hypothetical protein
MLGLFGRARAGMALTPAERAVLRLIEGVLLAGMVAAAPVVAHALAGQHPDLVNALHVGLSAFCVAALGAILKYVRAFGDPPIGGSGAAAPGA